MLTGVVIPQTELGAHDMGALRAFAEAVQDLGYDFITTSDHVLGADPSGHPGWIRPQTHLTVVHEPFVLFGYLAAVVPKLGLLTSVVILPQRQATLVAKQAAELDVVSGGKLRLGVGIGWNPVEFEALGMSFHDRGKRFEEQIELMRNLWSAESITFRGEQHTVTAAGIAPLPIQRPIPLWIGGTAQTAVKRATRIADGYLPLAPMAGTSGYAETMGLVNAWLAEAGRDPSTFGVQGRIGTATGNPDTWRQQAEEWHRLGASHLEVMTQGAGLQSVDAHIKRLRELRPILDV